MAAHDDAPDGLVPVVRDSMWLGIVTGLLGAATVFAVPLIGRVCGVPQGTLSALGEFPLLLATSTLVAAIGNSATSTLVGLGRSRLVMRAGLTGTAASVLLSMTLVNGVGPLSRLGLAGAGRAMLVSSLISATVAHWGLRRSTVLAGRRLTLDRPSARAVLRLASVGLPLGATVLIKFAVLGVLSVAAARVGTASAAAHSIAVSLVNFMFTAAVAIGQATIPLITPYARARDVHGLRAGVRAAVVTALCTVLLLGCVVTVLREPVLSLFSRDPMAQHQVLHLLPLLLLVVVTDALQAVFGFGLIMMRNTVPSLAVFAVCYGLLALAAVPVSTLGGLTALWLTLACANGLLVLGQGAFFYRRSGSLPADEATLGRA
ncbi:MATE family efflux transporter [Streptomyces toxytricini]|uniref:MATE family efflux transporter n=1 Tax=Streptomyces toxytricini TaxID=67369 RepID=UPI00344331E7